MFERLKAHWLSITGYLIGAWGIVRGLWGWIGDIDLAVTLYNEPGWLGTVAKTVNQHMASPPPYVVITAMALGVGLIILDRRISQRNPTVLKAITRITGRPVVRAVHHGDMIKRIIHGGKKGQIKFDYSTYDGVVQIGVNEGRFDIRFSSSSSDSVHFYRIGNTELIARVRNANPGDTLTIKSFDSTSWSYTLDTGDRGLAVNKAGHTMVIRIVSIQCSSHGDDRDEVVFDYVIYPPGQSAKAN